MFSFYIWMINMWTCIVLHIIPLKLSMLWGCSSVWRIHFHYNCCKVKWTIKVLTMGQLKWGVSISPNVMITCIRVYVVCDETNCEWNMPKTEQRAHLLDHHIKLRTCSVMKHLMLRICSWGAEQSVSIPLNMILKENFLVLGMRSLRRC